MKDLRPRLELPQKSAPVNILNFLIAQPFEQLSKKSAESNNSLNCHWMQLFVIGGLKSLLALLVCWQINVLCLYD